MANLTFINGSANAGKFLEKADDNVLTITSGLDAVNSPEATKKVKGLDALKPFIRVLNGLNGHTEVVKSWNVWGIEDGDQSDAPTTNETYESWFYTRKGLKIKDFDFSSKLIEDAYEAGKPLAPLVQERVKGISQWYLQKYLPNSIYLPLMVVPTGADAASYRAAPKGFLNGTPVPQELLKPGITNLTRQHYLGVDNATAGCTFEDIENVVEMMSEYIDISDSNIIGMATRATLSKLKSTLAYTGNQDIFARSGVPVETIAGVQFMINDMIPKNKILFLNGDANDIITKLESPKADMRGLAIQKTEGFRSMESISDFVGSFYRVMPEGAFVTGRHQGCWLDIGHDSQSGAVGGEMAEAGKAEIINHGKVLKAMYARSVV